MTRLIGPVVPSLIGWGRSPTADLVFRTLVTFGPTTAPELVRGLGMSRHRVTAALDELHAIGAAVAGPATARREAVWSARKPEEVIASLRRRRTRPVVSDPTRQHRERHALTRRLVGEAYPPGDGLRHLRTRNLTRDRLGELVAVVQWEHLAMNTERVFDAESAQPAVSMDRVLLRRGVRPRVLGLESTADPDQLLRYGRRRAEPSPEYREAASVPMKLIVVDRKIALFPVAPDDLSHGYLEVSRPSVVSALVAIFETHWAGSRDPKEYRAPRIMLTPRERTLVDLLAQGHTDATAATALRISPRSVSNILRALMDRLSVDNRFQLGLVLGALHAVAVPNKPEESR